jgi:hypothetical protein
MKAVAVNSTGFNTPVVRAFVPCTPAVMWTAIASFTQGDALRHFALG